MSGSEQKIPFQNHTLFKTLAVNENYAPSLILSNVLMQTNKTIH